MDGTDILPRKIMKDNRSVVKLINGFPDFKVPDFDMEKYNSQFREYNSIICAASRKIEYDKHWGGLSLKFVTKGTENYRTDYSKYAVDTSNFLILNKDTEYSSFIDSDDNVESFTLNFSEVFTNQLLSCLTEKTEKILDNNFNVSSNCPRFIEKLYAKDTLITPIVSKIYERLPQFEAENDQVSELFLQLFIALLQLNRTTKIEIDSVGKIKASTREELYKRLYYAKDYIYTCYNQDIGLEEISNIALLSKEYLIRQFTLKFKISPMQYLTSIRMNKAAEFLAYNKFSITEICEKVGYSDLTSFGKLFKKTYGLSPGAYKKSMRVRV